MPTGAYETRKRGARAPRTRGYKKRERTRGQLLDAAVQVIAEKGEAFSVSDVVQCAEVSNGTFYNYFHDREALLEAVAPKLAEAFAAEAAAAAPEGDAALRFASITARACLAAATDPERARALLRLEIPRALARDNAHRYLSEDLADGLAQGRFEVGAEPAVIDVVAGALWMGIRRIVEGEAGADADAQGAYVAALVARLLRGLGVPARQVGPLAARAVAAARELGPPRAVAARFPA